MSGRNLTTTRSQVFGDVEKGTECRICGRNVEDGRSKTCSRYCNNLLGAVMGMLNWSTVRRRVIDRDGEVCQHCGFDYYRERVARTHIRDRIRELAGERPAGPSASDLEAIDEFDWEEHHERVDEWNKRRDELQQAYGDPNCRSRGLEVDHITPVSKGGHPFDPGNLQTLCEVCHAEKTARENSGRAATPSREELNESLFEYVSDSSAQCDEGVGEV